MLLKLLNYADKLSRSIFKKSIFNTKEKNSNIYNICYAPVLFVKSLITRAKRRFNKVFFKSLTPKQRRLTRLRPQKLIKLLMRRKKKKIHREINMRVYFTKIECFEFIEKIKFIPFFDVIKKDAYIFFKRLPNLHNMWIVSHTISYIYSKITLVNFSRKLYNVPNLHKLQNNSFAQTFNTLNINALVGLKSLWTFVKIWLFSIMFVIMAAWIILINRGGLLNHVVFFWVALVMLLYWLLSGFVYFVKKYQYSKYTSVIQRFWRRAYILFWLIESGLLLVFFYLMINSSQESYYMFDQAFFLKTHLFSWKLFILKAIITTTLIIYGYNFLLNLKWSTFSKNILFLLVLTTILLYLLWIEAYQIYWVSNFYANYFWLFDTDEMIWSLEWDGRRTRIINHYIMILFLLKFWHIVFIVGCWIFFLLRSNELDKINYPLYSFNYQNFIILFIMNWLFMYPWLRHLYHWAVEIPYYWFYVDTHLTFSQSFFMEIANYFVYGLATLKSFFLGKGFKLSDFNSWSFFEIVFDSRVYIKNTIKEQLLSHLT